MSASPNIVFSAFRSSSDAAAAGWAQFRENVLGVATVSAASPAPAKNVASTSSTARMKGSAPTAPTAPGIWRLLASNNREVGRSAFLYTSFTSARVHVIRLQDRASDLEVTIVNGPTAGTHGWYATLEGTSVMTCGRWYGAAGLSLEAAAGALQALRSALVHDDALRVTAPGERHRHRTRPTQAVGPTW